MKTETKTKMISAALFSLLLGACGSDPGVGAGASGAAGTATAGIAGTAGAAGTTGTAGTGSSTTGTGTGGAMAPKPPATTVEETLDRLGVDRNVGDRTGADGKPLPATFSPIDNQAVFKKVSEVFTLGVPLASAAGSSVARSGKATFVQLDQAASPDLMAKVTPEPAWAAAAGTAPSVRRAAAVGDFDGDGREETAVVWVNTADTAHNKELSLTIIEDSLAATPFAVTTSVVTLQGDVQSLALATGDFDGDNQVDVAIGVVTSTQGKVLFARNDKGAFTLDAAGTKTLAPTVANGTGMSLSLRAARLDTDAGAELVAVVNEPFKLNGNDAGAVRWIAYDDAKAGYAQLTTGGVSAGPGLPAAVEAEAAVGDIDGDGLDEIVLGGLGAYHQDCAPYDNVAVAFDDAAHGFATLGGTSWTEIWNDCDDASPFRIRWAPVRTLNVDLDDEQEILVGNRIFDDWKSSQTFKPLRALPQSAFVQKHDAGFIDRSTTAVATGDFTGDGIDDVMVYSQDRAALTVLENKTPGVAAPAGSLPSLAPTKSTPVVWKSSSDPQNAVLLPVNVDNDSMSLRRASFEHKLVFTQPIVIAALAAAPCQDGIGQNTDACVTTYGTATSSTVGKEQVLSVSAGISVGIKVTGGEITQSEASVKATVKTTASMSTGSSSTISRSVTFTSGPMEDSVVFSTVPYDQYEYTVLTHPDAKMVGATITVSVPRAPIVLIAERGFYNDAIPVDGLKIDENVFRHTPGDIATYPTQADVIKMQTQNASVLTNGPFSVGQTGSTSFQLDVGSEYSSGQKLALDYEIEAEATVATVIGGFSVGAGVESSLTVTSGRSTSYSGTVGSISDRAAFANNLYSYGIFTYVQKDAGTGQQFEVVNFWVQK
jgi:hypothetical protein